MAESSYKEYENALEIARNKLWAEYDMDARSASRASAEAARDDARDAALEAGLKFVVAEMRALFDADPGAAFLNRANLLNELGFEIVCVDYGGKSTFVEQFAAFADKFTERGFSISTVTVERDETRYFVRDERRGSAGVDWTLRLTFPAAMLGDLVWLRNDLMARVETARATGEMMARSEAEKARAERYKRYLELRAEFEEGGGSDVGED